MITLSLATKPTYHWEGDTDLGMMRVSCEYDLNGDFDARLEIVDEEATMKWTVVLGQTSPVYKAPSDVTEWRMAFDAYLKAQFDAAKEEAA